MAHIALDNDLPGISGLMAHRKDTGEPLNHLAEILLRGPSPISRGERELIAAYVSQLNATPFCAGSHSAFAAAQLAGGERLVASVLADPATAPITPLLRALLRIAAEVQSAAAPVSDEAVAAARAEGAGDTEIHDTVLIAAAFCLYNRYVSGLATTVPDADYYRGSAERIVARGYRGSYSEA
ncbi:carboxymuconolactone decarboxylase family protein [Streptomyces yaizuensis]|uniref:Carboxymuconolactone decarboxylase family protein n=1 Tax=Streptomyces yaizuensis TaxID=2989713 RepID=A0ABQ5NS86_9ACTN|nr:carboxymuconolactone decarboxylase family protein [Streptomyces sp. YSPA8]GLF93220.1 carboxymuconolactone decarboxylase family protein [Streptomyces sp. YSPA8]